MKKIITKYILLTFLFLVFCTVGYSQPSPGGGSPPAAVPIDGGLSLLAAAGIGLGARKYFKKKKED